MSRLYYTNHLMAAWMAQEYGVVFFFQGVCHPDSLVAEEGYRAPISIKTIKSQGGMGDRAGYLEIYFNHGYVPERHFVHAGSLPMFIPQKGDFILMKESHDIFEVTKDWQIRDLLGDKNSWQIILRNNKVFFMPEMEESEA